jgi:hypothetical protein
MRLIAVGRLREGPEAALFARYNARLRPQLAITEIAEAKGAPAEAKRREGAAILAALPATAFAVALDPDGIAPDSAALAKLLERWLGFSRPLCFLIGRGAGRGGDRPGRCGALAWKADLAAYARARVAGRTAVSRQRDPVGTSLSSGRTTLTPCSATLVRAWRVR